VLKAHSRVLEQLMLVGDLLLVAGCWLAAYGIRFHVAGPRSHGTPPVEPYLLMLLPILLVWGIAFRAFDLYRPRRIGSRLSEITDIAKASTMGALVLISIMTFFFRGYDYSYPSPATSSAKCFDSRGDTATTSATRWWWAAESWRRR